MSPTLDAYRGEADGWHSLKDGSLFGGTPSDPPGAGGVFGDPGPNKVYLGQTIGPGVSLSGRETYYTKPLGMYHTYWNHNDGTTAITNGASQALAAGRIPLMSMKFPGLNWSQVAAGNADATINAFLAGWAALGKGPILWAPHSEPNGDETTGSTSATYISMYLHLMSLKAAWPQILLVPILAAGPSNISSGLQFSAWMTSASCDLFGFNTYNHLSYNPDNSGIAPSTTSKHNYSTVSQCLDRQIAQMAAIDSEKKWIVGEFNTRTVTATAHSAAVPGKAAQWMVDFYDKARTSGAYGICAFDSNANVNDAGSPWTLDDTTDTSDGVERIAQQKANALKSTSAYIPLGGIAA
jgi:hypothetical protein